MSLLFGDASMTRLIPCLLILGLLSATEPQTALAQIEIVAPTGLDNVEGTGSLAAGSVPLHSQQLYLASEFSSLPAGGAWLVGISERLDSAEANAVVATWDDLSLTISTTQSQSLSRTFADNVGPDAVTVYDFDAPIQVTYEVNAGGNPNPFLSASQSQFDRPFFYDPSAGNLLLEYVTRSGSSVAFDFDSQQNGLIARLRTSLDLDSPTAEIWSAQAIVDRFIFVPEPSTFTLMLFAGMSLLAPLRRRKV